MRFYQCQLQQSSATTIGWIEARGAKLGEQTPVERVVGGEKLKGSASSYKLGGVSWQQSAFWRASDEGGYIIQYFTTAAGKSTAEKAFAIIDGSFRFDAEK